MNKRSSAILIEFFVLLALTQNLYYEGLFYKLQNCVVDFRGHILLTNFGSCYKRSNHGQHERSTDRCCGYV